ncbi:MAG: type III secretion system export apparatus subunit SctU [Planctomycetota bacterium]|jgi:type III secretion protein U|nr:type III secretion system export apparatus subunit SctU [Planctomycetota bacterium]
MAEDKTEEPTDKHLRDAKEEGQVVKSQEISATAVVLSVILFVWLGFDWLNDKLKELLFLTLGVFDLPFSEALKTVGQAAVETFLVLSLSVVALAAVAGTVGHLAQTGIMFAWKAATPKLDKLNPKQWFSKVFSLKNLVEFLRSLVKIGVVILAFYLSFDKALPLLLRLPDHNLDAIPVVLGLVMRDTATYSIAAFVAIAALDWLFQRWQFLKEHRMSKDEVKKEYKEMEGDPQIKGQRRQLHQEMAMEDRAQSVRQADVLVTNPTHLAIAIEYKSEKNPLPVILAKGEGALAARMMKIAAEAGIPVMRNVPLAHDLWEQGQEMQYIPSSLIESVAEVLVWLRDLRESQGGQL